MRCRNSNTELNQEVTERQSTYHTGERVDFVPILELPQPDLPGIPRDQAQVCCLAQQEVERMRKKNQELQYENHRLKEKIRCKVCLESEACVLFLPCGHLKTCESCARSISTCCICRAHIGEKKRAYTY